MGSNGTLLEVAKAYFKVVRNIRANVTDMVSVTSSCLVYFTKGVFCVLCSSTKTNNVLLNFSHKTFFEYFLCQDLLCSGCSAFYILKEDS